MKAQKTMRVLLVSDMHYTTEQTHDELVKTYPESRTTPAAGDAFGHTQAQKIQAVLQGILEENAKAPLDLVLVLGDLSVDDYDWRNLPENYCVQFREEVMKKLPCPVYAIPGNHDSYPNDRWREMFGYDRQFAVEQDGALFVMLDTFPNCPAASGDGSGSHYQPADAAFLEKVLKEHPGLPTFLCSHYFGEQNESEEFRRIVRENPNIYCLFRGHTHIERVIPLDESWGNKILVDIGGYGYTMKVFDGPDGKRKFDFNYFGIDWAWGYEVLEIGADAIRLHHRKPARRYVAHNGTYRIPEIISDTVELPR